MQLSPQISHGSEAIDALATPWDLLWATCAAGLQGPDATCSSTWARALVRTHLDSAELQVLSVSSSARLEALVPTYRQRVAALPFARRELRTITEAHGGRTGLLLASPDPALVDFVLAQLQARLAPWDVFVFSAVEGSASHSALVEVARRRSLPVRCIGIHESPYIELGSHWDEVVARLPKKMRWTIRKSEGSLRERGALEYQEIREPSAVGALLESIRVVERNSWKEQAGSSVTSHPVQERFYESLAAAAAGSGMLSAHVLRLDAQPIAYVLGLVAGDGVFLDLKESFDASFSEYSPGHVLKRFTMPSLIARGVRVYDFMGRCEPYKMRWTDRTYRSLTFALYNSTLRGRISHLRARLGGHSFAPRQVPPAGTGRAAALGDQGRPTAPRRSG